jgi:formylglycine-generating enzyme
MNKAKTHFQRNKKKLASLLLVVGLCLLIFFLVCSCNNGASSENPVIYDALTGNEKTPQIEWIRTEAGDFTFGAPESLGCRASQIDKEVPVRLTRSFLMAATELTQAQWDALDYPNPSKPQGSNYPLNFVSFYEAAAWCNKLSLLEGLDTCYNLESCKNSIGTGCGPKDPWEEEGCNDKSRVFHCDDASLHKYNNWYACPGYRLPTTAEWEYAAKAGTDTHTYGGDLIYENHGHCQEQPTLNDIAWYCFNSNDQIHEVAQKQPNPWGLYDMLGNLYEVVDYFSDGSSLDYYASSSFDGSVYVDPMGKITGKRKDMRGGAFDYTGCYVNPTWQSGTGPYDRLHFQGFRPVRSILE